MANITKRNGSYLIRVSMGRDANRKQIIRSTTYKPPEGISEKRLKSWQMLLQLILKINAAIILSIMRI